MSQELKRTANSLKMQIHDLTPSRANIGTLKFQIQKLIDTLIQINSEESLVAKDSLLHLIEQEIHIVEKSKDEESLLKNFKSAQAMADVDFSGI
jgi:hypothetical protein